MSQTEPKKWWGQGYRYPRKNHFRGKTVGFFFEMIEDDEIQDIINACQEELELRSQEAMKNE